MVFMETLKIAMFSWESLYSIRVGGMAPAVTHLSEALADKGHEVHVFTRIGDNQPFREEIEGVVYQRCAFDPTGNILEFCDKMADSMINRFYEVEKEGKFDVLHGHDWHVINALNHLKLQNGYPFTLTYHSTEWGRNGNAFGDWYEFGEISGREWYGGYAADRITTVSHTMKDELGWLYNIPDWKVDVIPNGIKAERFKREVDPGRVKQKYGIHPLAPLIFFIGRLVTQKGPDLLVNAISHVLRYRWDARFVIAGGGGMRGHLEYLTRKNGVSHAVQFLGYIPDEEYLELLNASDIVCIPSRNEPFGLVLLEAWSAGKAVVATDVGGLGENINNFVNGIKVFPTPESIAWGINYIINDPQGVKSLGEQGQKAARKFFNWNTIVSRYLKFYKQ